MPISDFLLSYEQMSPSGHSPVNSNESLSQPSQEYRHTSGRHSSHGQSRSFEGSTWAHATATGHHRPGQVHQLCIVCRVKPCRDGEILCGMKCNLKFAVSFNPAKYLERSLSGHSPGNPNQCAHTCGQHSPHCQSRSSGGSTGANAAAIILEARPGHTIYNEVEERFERAWKVSSTPCPPIKRIYKIIQNESLRLSYDRYKRRIGNEVFRYHGTSRSCNLGSQGNTKLCTSSACALCSILRTSFKVSLADPLGAFGPGIYTTSASNKAYSYSNDGTGAVILTKVVLGTVYDVHDWNEVMSCPRGYNSVVYNRHCGKHNETIVYTEDAIRPVYLIIF